MRASTSISSVAMASLAAAQSLLPMNPGGAVPYGVQAPGIGGFTNSTIQPSRGGLAVCVSGYVSVTASTSKNVKLNFQVPANQSQVTETFVEYVTSGSPFMTSIMGSTQNVSGTYDIYGTLCTPANNTKPSTVELLTHGIGFDRTYWDFAPGYSWVDVAVENGHAAFFYDRLSVGMSTKPNGLDVAQAPLEVEIAKELATMLRGGDLANATFSSVIGVGHSFGSVITQAVTSMYPSSFDAAVLTGFSVNMTALPTFISALNLEIASLNQPYRFAALPNGYLVSSTVISNQIGFFRAPGFDPQVLSLAEATKGTVTFGELFTQSAVSAPAMNFTGPVAVVNGAEDFPFCFGNCSYPTNQPAAVQAMLYPKVANSSFTTFLAPTAGHGLNLHYSAVQAYDFVQSFLSKQGL